MVKVRGTFSDAIGALTVGQYEAARRELEEAIGIDHASRTSWNLYVKGARQMRMNQVLDCKTVFERYGIEWQFDSGNVAVNTLTQRRAANYRQTQASEI